ncbi:major facilitator superfamily domain-containing protein [Trichoderma breve]|uniref:Major facilitator superfamily domain-containing protein n=1 Tax=Trichoderma breve TaxID=2034170 RepID=A0A9W9E6A0_9HYPO|nr:major facilitator superfamily domain-containing protein [Trichoderma breve]KAJ4859025.1 major facilitator superfamily domain-containing protein [Trichoderma breve]
MGNRAASVSEFAGSVEPDQQPSRGKRSLASDVEKGPINEAIGQSNAPGPTIQTYTNLQWVSVLIAIYSSEFLYGLDTTIVADIQGSIISDLGGVTKLGWLSVGFPLGSVATMLMFGKAYAIFDIKWLYFGSLVTFTAGSALCGASPNMDALIVGRVCAGAGGAGMYLGVLNLITVNTNEKRRSSYIAFSGVVWGLGCVLGPIIGGAFADSNATWRWAFYLNVVLFGLFSPVVVFVIRSHSFRPNESFAFKIRSIDWIGAVLNAAIYTVFVVIFTFAGSEWAWDSGQVIALWIVLAVILAAFAASQYFTVFTTRDNRLFPGEFLRSRTMVLLYVCQAAVAAALFIPIYYIPLYSQFVFGDRSIQAGVRLLPLIIIGVAANMFQGVMAPRLPYYMSWFLISGIFTLTAGALFYAAVDTNTSSSRLYGFSVILAIGAGLTQQTAYGVAPSKVPPSRIPEALSFINMAQIGGLVIGLTLTSTVFQNVGFRNVSNALSGFGYSDADSREALSGFTSTVFSQATPEIQDLIVESVSKTINTEYIFVITAGIVEIIASLLMKREKLEIKG